MNRAALIAVAGLAGFAAWRLMNQAGQEGEGADLAGGDVLGDWGEGFDVLGNADTILADATQGAAQLFDTLTGGAMQVSAMARVDRGIVNHPNVQAFLRVIRTGEGTADEAGYRRLFGGRLFDSFADHPRQVVRASGYTSTAAGAYQFLASTWDETRQVMRLADFSPASQDLAAVGRLAARGALADVIAGRFDQAIAKTAREWASLPGSPYGQPTITMARARSVFASAGGTATA